MNAVGERDGGEFGASSISCIRVGSNIRSKDEAMGEGWKQKRQCGDEALPLGFWAALSAGSQHSWLAEDFGKLILWVCKKNHPLKFSPESLLSHSMWSLHWPLSLSETNLCLVL